MVRSSQAEVRNPILALPSLGRVQSLPPEAQAALWALLDDLAKDAASRAQVSWVQNKAPMAAYWKAVSVYAKHVRAVLRRRKRSRPRPTGASLFEARGA